MILENLSKRKKQLFSFDAFTYQNLFLSQKVRFGQGIKSDSPSPYELLNFRAYVIKGKSKASEVCQMSRKIDFSPQWTTLRNLQTQKCLEDNLFCKLYALDALKRISIFVQSDELTQTNSGFANGFKGPHEDLLNSKSTNIFDIFGCFEPHQNPK